MIFKKDELRYLWVFYIERFIAFLLYFAPAFWILQFQQYLSLLQIGILFSVLSVFSFLFEIPTGAVADLYGRKFSVILGYILTTISTICLFFVRDFKLLILVFAVWGIAGTFYSGAKEAWVVDNLNYQKRKNLVKEFFTREQSIMLISLCLSGILGAYLVSLWGLNIIWIFAALSYLISAAMLFLVVEHKVTKEKKIGFRELFAQSRKSVKYAWGHHVLFFIIVATFFIIFRDAFGGDIVWQPFLKSLGFPLYAFGILFSISSLLGAFAPMIANKISKKFKRESVYLAFLLFVMIILDISVAFINNYVIGAAVLLAMFFLIYAFTPVNQTLFHRHTPGKLRATITSFKGMIISLAYALSYPLSGYLADLITPRYTIAFGALILVPALVLYLKIKDKE